MKNFNYSLFGFLIFLIFLSFSACESSDPDKFDDEDLIEMESQDEEQDGHEEDDEHDEEDCFEFVFPISYEMPDGSTLTGNDEEEIDDLIDDWYESNGDVDLEPELLYPVQIISGDRILDVNSEEDLERLYEELCKDEEDDDEHDEEECFEFVYPISYEMPDGSIITGDSEEAIFRQIDEWYEINGDADMEPTLVFPIQVILGDRIIDVNSERELERLYEELCEEYEDDDAEHDEEDCFEYVYPISYEMPDGSTLTGNNEEEIDRQIEEWYEINGENDQRPQLVFPVQVIFGDRIFDASSEEELERLYAELCRDHDDDDEFDCEELRADIGDPCRRDNGTVGEVNEDCECE